MKQLLILNIVLIMMFTIGCESDDSPTTPTTSTEYQIILENLPDSLIWLAGAEMTIPVNALVLQKDGGVAPEVRVELASISNSGSFDTPGLTSDQHGRISATANITVREGWQEFSPLLIVPGGSVTSSIAIRGVRKPARIAFDAPNTTFKVANGATVETTFKAVFSDEDGLGIAGLPVRVGLKDLSEVERVFGSVSAPGLTNEAGELQVEFSSLGGLGRVNIQLQANLPGMSEGLDSALTMKVQRMTDDIGSLTIRVFPNFLYLERDVLGEADIRAQVKNTSNVGIPNVQLLFETDFGTLSNITPTDSNGVARPHWQSNYEAGTTHIVARIPGTEWEATTQIVVMERNDSGGRLEISTDTDLIFADGGLTVARIRALLKDGDGQALANKVLVFTSTHGAITSPLVTNALGIVDTIFTDVGLPSLDRNGNLVPAIIYVKYDPLNLRDSCEVTIRPRNPVTMLMVTSNKLSMQAASGDTATIRATALLANGNFAPRGTFVNFEVGGAGGWCDPSVVPIGRYGVVETRYTCGDFVGTAVIRAYVINDDDSIVYSNEVEIELLPGPPNNIRLTANPGELMTSDPQAFSRIEATVTDTAGNAVEQGTLVRFTTTSGDMTPVAITDATGRATARLTPGVTAGVAEVTGTVTLSGGATISGVTTVTFVAGDPNSIRITADPEVIQAAETGGNSNSTISALIVDSNGNPVGRPTTVVFTLPNEPEGRNGCTWPNGTKIDSTRTDNGIAQLSLSAGLMNGPVFIKAYTWRDPDTTWENWEDNIPGQWRVDTVRAQGYFVRVEGGVPIEPPMIEIGYDTDGDDGGGGTWQIPVSARLLDSDENPWPNNVPVGFTLLPNDAGSIDAGTTGNDIGFGSEPGVAWSWLYYHSVKSMDFVTIQAEVQLEDRQVTAQMRIQLPLQDGTLQVVVDPQNWQFDRESPDDTCLVRIWSMVQDGHQINIDNVPIRYSTSRGRLYTRDGVGEPWVDRGREVIVTSEESLYLRCRLSDLEDGPGYVGSIIINADLPGYGVEADPAFLFVSVR